MAAYLLHSGQVDRCEKNAARKGVVAYTCDACGNRDRSQVVVRHIRTRADVCKRVVTDDRGTVADDDGFERRTAGKGVAAHLI